MRIERSASEAITEVSSANSRVKSHVAKCKSLIKQRNSMGPKMLPYSTDISMGSSMDLELPISVNWDLPDR